jgi:hypothetical protein
MDFARSVRLVECFVIHADVEDDGRDSSHLSISWRSGERCRARTSIEWGDQAETPWQAIGCSSSGSIVRSLSTPSSCCGCGNDDVMVSRMVNLSVPTDGHGRRHAKRIGGRCRRRCRCQCETGTATSAVVIVIMMAIEKSTE